MDFSQPERKYQQVDPIDGFPAAHATLGPGFMTPNPPAYEGRRDSIISSQSSFSQARSYGSDPSTNSEFLPLTPCSHKSPFAAEDTARMDFATQFSATSSNGFGSKPEALSTVPEIPAQLDNPYDQDWVLVSQRDDPYTAAYTVPQQQNELLPSLADWSSTYYTLAEQYPFDQLAGSNSGSSELDNLSTRAQPGGGIPIRSLLHQLDEEQRRGLLDMYRNQYDFESVIPSDAMLTVPEEHGQLHQDNFHNSFGSYDGCSSPNTISEVSGSKGLGCEGVKAETMDFSLQSIAPSDSILNASEEQMQLDTDSFRSSFGSYDSCHLLDSSSEASCSRSEDPDDMKVECDDASRMGYKGLIPMVMERSMCVSKTGGKSVKRERRSRSGPKRRTRSTRPPKSAMIPVGNDVNIHYRTEVDLSRDEAGNWKVHGRLAPSEKFVCGLPLIGGGTCQKQFQRQEHRNRHAETHIGEKRFKCKMGPECTKIFNRSDNYGVHYMTHVIVPGKKHPGRNKPKYPLEKVLEILRDSPKIQEKVRKEYAKEEAKVERERAVPESFHSDRRPSVRPSVRRRD